MSQARVLNATGEDNKCQQEGPPPMISASLSVCEKSRTYRLIENFWS